MLITNLEVQKKNTSRFSLFVDNNFVIGISAATIAQYNLYKGKTIEEDLLKEINHFELLNRFFDRTLGYISGMMKSEFSIRTYLKNLAYKKKGDWFSEDYFEQVEDIIEKVIEKLKKYNYINDKQYAQEFIQARLKYKPRSHMQLEQELYSKGISKDIISDLLKDYSNSDTIYLVYKKKFGDTKIDKDDRKKIDFLARKGFNWDDISNLMKRMNNDTGE
ncbi:MAG TPA: RecX family transcriptional regulator [Candidatus Dojkabacteria bacterium]|nr:RecX family transcriptional regulator [Candidatus Dojkabacteria bacterium]